VKINKKLRLTATQTIATNFALIILIGTLLLMLPIANKSGEFIPFLNALFTATSATCVTGLVIYDTWSQFTIFGQLVIMLLIQIGGLGFMTMVVLFFMVLKKRIGLRERELITESVNSMQIGGIIRLVRQILIGTAAIELTGALLLATRFCPRFGFWQGIWYGLFHAVSSFCNAGFDLMGQIKPYSSLTYFADDLTVNLTVMALIVIGGIGFVLWNDLLNNKLHFWRYSLHTKIMLVGTAILIFGTAAILLLTERGASMAGMTFSERILASLFQSVTPRTAGFNTVDTGSMSSAGTLITMVMMFVGAGPGSTAGGIKITTAAIMLLSIISYSRGHNDMNVFRRRIDQLLMRRAFCTAVFYFLMAITGALVITIAQDLPLKDVLFEAFSALGTVGLSTGITRDLITISRIVIILLMYSGRVGSLTVILSVSERQVKTELANPTEKIIVG